MKIRFAGVTATEKYLNVHFELRLGSVAKYGVVPVPLTQLLHPEITDALDAAVRRRLVQVWSEVDLADPLF